MFKPVTQSLGRVHSHKPANGSQEQASNQQDLVLPNLIQALNHSEQPAVAMNSINIGASDEINGSQIADKNDFIKKVVSGISNNNVEEDEEEQLSARPANKKEKIKAVQDALQYLQSKNIVLKKNIKNFEGQKRPIDAIDIR